MEDLQTHTFGSAVEDLGNGRYRVDWDEPTPFQHLAAPTIPSRFFRWVHAAEDGGTSDTGEA